VSKTILVIDDNEDHAILTKRYLKMAEQPYDCDVAYDAKEGLEKALSKDYDLILCDYRMAGMTALDILKALKEKKDDIPFIAATSSGSEKIAVELMKAGAYDYIIKDSSFEDNLPIIIEKAIDRYNIKKEKEMLKLELEASNAKLKEMYEIKSEFTSMVSHELRTPLAAIKEGIAIVLDGSAGEINADQQDFLSMAKRNVDRLKRLIDDVLDFSKLESKRMVFMMKKGNFSEVINEVAGTQNTVAKERGLYLKVEIDEKLPELIFDADRINQVLNNLVSNSLKFTNQGGVTIKCDYVEDKDYIEIIVQDTGEGIRSEDIPKLFQKFQQLGGANSRKTGGTGLGLAICKEIIENHNGSIWVESEIGKGSEFKFILPTKISCKILIVDDDVEALSLCKRVMEDVGYIVVSAETGAEGIKKAKEETPNLIVLDMRLKDMGGYEVIGRLRSEQETSSIPILGISGYIDEIEKLKIQEEKGALPWLLKPFDNDEFISKVKSMLDSRDCCNEV